MRVLHLVSYFPPDRIGGVGEVAAQVHRRLRELGVSSTVWTSGRTRDDPDVVRVAPSPATFVARSALRFREASGFDVIHTHHAEALLLLAANRLQPKGPPVLLTLHVNNGRFREALRPVRVRGVVLRDSGAGNWIKRYVRAPMRQVMDHVGLSLADGMSFISRDVASDFSRDLAIPHRVIYNGVPPLERPPVADVPEIFDLLYVGTSGHNKRVGLLPFVLSDIRDEHQSCRMRIVGLDCAKERDLWGQFRRLGLQDAVECVGIVRSEDLARYYAAASVLLVPSAYEGTPMVILEAQRLGVPCVATDVGGIGEIVTDGVNGRLVPRDDVSELARACVEIVTNPAMALRMGSAGREAMNTQFTVERQVDEYLEMYRDLMRDDRADE